MTTNAQTDRINHINSYCDAGHNAALKNLNYDDTEELPTSEGLDQCHLFSSDIETLPLYQPRETTNTINTLRTTSAAGSGPSFARSFSD